MQESLTSALVSALVMLLAAGQSAQAQPLHGGSFSILTTPDGADLPASAHEKDFPVLLRLNKDFFDFSQTQPHGEDIYFLLPATNRGLAHQIEEWDAARGTASIWVRIPEIRGNARQLVGMVWGQKVDGKGLSNGSAVFNESNGYAVVMHLSNPENPVKDEVGTVSPGDHGTTPCPGMIGAGRHFEAGKGIACGEKITGLPTGFGPHTTQAWFKAERVNAIAAAWGNEQGQGKVTMCVHSPPHVRMECYFSSADVAGKSRLPMSEWVHVVHAYQQGESRIYLNGRLDGVTKGQGAFLNIRNPARMFLGGWYNNYRFVGDMDEVRISKLTRSADWVKLEYENQKPLQTLVGPLVRSGDEFSVSQNELTVLEGRSATVTATVGGAQKIYWILKRGDQETVAAVDQLSYTFKAGRVAGDESLVLRLKAVFEDKVKIKDIPVTVKEDIPEPVFTLKAPAKWDARETIEIVPQIANLAEMLAKGASDLKYDWNTAGIAVIKAITPGRLLLKRAQNSGKFSLTLAVSNGGARTVRGATILVEEPKKDAWIPRVPAKDEKPEEGQFYARDDKNEGTLFYNGTLDDAGDAVFLKVYAGEQLYRTESQKPAGDKTYAFSVKLKPGLVLYRAEFGTKTGGEERVLHSVGDLVCGDAYLIDGQSNALATDTGEESPRDTSPWIRSYGGPTGRGDGAGWVRDRINEAKRAGQPQPNLWCRPVWKARPQDRAELGYWGMELAKRLVASQQMPIFIINAAVGGTRIDEHQPSSTDRGDLGTMYGRMLWRVRESRMTHGIRAVLWHQGESDQGSDGPTGGYGWETYQMFFENLSGAWKEDMPNLQQYYVYQIWPDACSMGGRQGSGDRLREVQRTLPRLYSNMSIMSTLGIKPPGGCHYPLTGWAEFARLIQPMMERDFYGKVPAGSISPPDLRNAYYTGGAKDEIVLEFDQPVAAWREGLVSQFYLDDQAGQVTSGRVSGNVMRLTLKGASAAKKLTYVKERGGWSQEKLIWGTNGIAALTFCDVPILQSSPAKAGTSGSR